MATGNDLQPGELVHLREWQDGSGWVILRDIIFMVVSHAADPAGDRYRSIVRVTGAGHDIETCAGYFVKVAEFDYQTT
jgi:hypothetical protein